MANTYVKIAEVSVGAGGASSIDFTSIPSTYTDLVLKISARTNRSAKSDWVKISFNGSTTSFTYRNLEGSGAAAASYNGADRLAVYVDGNTSTANTFGNAEIYIPNYTGSTNKSFSGDSVQEDNDTGATMSLNANLWSNTAAITSISLTPNVGPNFLQYSTAYLYGILKS